MVLKIKIIYIAGSYRAGTENGLFENIIEARRAAVKLWKLGYIPIVPHLNSMFMGGVVSDTTFLKGGIEILKRCDAIYVLRNWRKSKGACEELRIAVQNNIKVIYEKDDIRLL